VELLLSDDVSTHTTSKALPACADVIIQIVDDKTIKTWETLEHPGVQHGDERSIQELDRPNNNLDFFRGCWIRYPLVSDLLQSGNPTIY
jgi:hypothetical protein